MRSTPDHPAFLNRAAWFLLPLIALLATLPLLLQGCSCGHDFAFHLQSWLEAAQQLRHGTLDPTWAYSPAFNAGEPRFIFYPPLSWMLGESLTLLAPFRFVPALYTWLVLSAAGCAMFAATRRFATPAAAFLAAALYLANPYMLFTAFERTAYAELLAAIWLPLLFAALLRDNPIIPSIAIPLALLWLTNAPAAVMASYTLALLALIRLAFATRSQRTHTPPLHLARTYLCGTALGLALPAFYLIPAAYERRFVQITMALVPGLSFAHNFLFAHTADPAHDRVLHQASLIAIALLITTACVLLLVFRQRRGTQTYLLTSFALLTLSVAFLLEPLSTPLWQHLPDLAFLQFPWRFLAILAVTAAFAIALLLDTVPHLRNPALTIPLAIAAALLLTVTTGRSYLQACGPLDTPTSIATLFHTGHGVPATDEYTPTNADNDILRSDDPAFWLTPDPAAFAPHTIPNPNATQPDVDFGTPPPDQTLSARAPLHLQLNLTQPEDLVLNLRDYPRWQLTRNATEHPPHLQRDDGLLAIALPAGASTIDLRWQSGRDRTLGLAVSLFALLALVFLAARSRKIKR